MNSIGDLRVGTDTIFHKVVEMVTTVLTSNKTLYVHPSRINSVILVFTACEIKLAHVSEQRSFYLLLVLAVSNAK